MNASDKQSVPGSESTLRSEHMAHESLGESQVLDRQVAEAKAAVLRTLDDVKANLGTAADVRLWTQRYPWFAIGVAAATGFAAASLVTPSREQSLQEKFDELTRGRQEHAPASSTERVAENAAAAASTRSAVMTTVFGSLFEILRMVVTNFATSAMRSPAGVTAPQNGQSDGFADAANQPLYASEQPDYPQT